MLPLEQKQCKMVFSINAEWGCACVSPVHVFRLCIAVSLCDAGLLQLKQAFSIFIRHLKNIHAGSVDKKMSLFTTLLQH